MHQDILQKPLGKQRLATVSSASSAYSRSDPDLLTWVLRCPGGWNFVRHGELLRWRHALGASEVAPCSCGATVDLVLAAHGLLDRRTIAIILGQSHDQNQPTTTFTTHFQTMTAMTTDSGEHCCQVWLPNIKVRPRDRLKSLTLLNRQQPMDPLGSWQQVAPSGHQDLESGHKTPAWTRPMTPAWTRPTTHTQFRETTR